MKTLRIAALLLAGPLLAPVASAQPVQLTPTPAASQPTITAEERIARAEALLAANQPQQVLSDLLPLMQTENKRVELWMFIGRAYRAMGSAPQALEACERAVRVDPNNVQANSLLGQLYLENKAYRLALRQLARAKQMDPRNAEVTAALAMAVLAGKEDQAQRHAMDLLNEAIELDPTQPMYLFRIGQITVDTGDPTRGLQRMHEAVNQGLALVRAKPTDLAINARCDEMASGLIAAYVGLAEKAEGDQKASLYVMISEAIRTRADLADRRALIERRQWLLLAIKTMPDSVDALLGYGLISLELGMTSEATTAFGQLVALAPNDPRVAQFRQQLAGVPTTQPLPVIPTPTPAPAPVPGPR